MPNAHTEYFERFVHMFVYFVVFIMHNAYLLITYYHGRRKKIITFTRQDIVQINHKMTS